MKSHGVTIQMKATEQYFPEVLLKMLYKIALSLWMKFYGVTIQINLFRSAFARYHLFQGFCKMKF